MYHSGEIRWFLEDGPRTQVQRWFSACDTAVAEQERTDSYIILPRCATAGVKIREGNIEVKAQTSPAAFLEVTDQVRGYHDAWVKWSRPASDARNFLARPTVPEHWAHVRKTRTLRLLSLEDEAPEEIAPRSRHLHSGCQAEQTDLRVALTDAEGEPSRLDWQQAERWWTLSLEAFGPPARVSALLQRAASYWFGREFPATLCAEDSMSYPAWLASLDETRRRNVSTI